MVVWIITLNSIVIIESALQLVTEIKTITTFGKLFLGVHVTLEFSFHLAKITNFRFILEISLQRNE